jgi:hypothetical protein
MLFFKRILDVRNKPAASAERRGTARYPVNREFPLQAVLNIAGRDEQGQPLRPGDREGWDWPGRLTDLSAVGARLQVPLTVSVRRGDTGQLNLDVEGYKLTIPCHIAHVGERHDSFVLGLGLDLKSPPAEEAYRQLLDLVALGSSLRLVKPLQNDPSGYLLEQYVGEPSSRLSIWRHCVGRELAAFEFLLKDCFVRGLSGSDELECYAGKSTAAGRAVTPAQAEEIRRLYQWVVLNLATVVPADARAFLLRLAV